MNGPDDLFDTFIKFFEQYENWLGLFVIGLCLLGAYILFKVVT